MKLVTFRVTNFRSVNDSGSIAVEDRLTAILGRNESGKSNLLMALASLNPPTGLQPLSPIKDFPRDRKLSECTDETPVVDTTWVLDDVERAELAAMCPRAMTVETVEVGRPYGAKRIVRFVGLSPSKPDRGEVEAMIQNAEPHLIAGAAAAPSEHLASVQAAVQAWETAAKPEKMSNWPDKALEASGALRQAFAAAGANLPDQAESAVAAIDAAANTLKGDSAAIAAVEAWAEGKLPTFIYLDDFPQLNGHQNIAEFIARRGNGQHTAADINFEKLCRVAGIDPDQLQALGQSDEHESRGQLTNRAGAVVTREIRRLWKDRKLTVTFRLDAAHFDTLVSDPNDFYDVHVNLDERSRGLRWFFSFFVIFTADTQGGDKDGAVLLLDEPGLFLHALSQADLLQHFDADFKNQIIYTTHSPFMVPTHAIERVRTANIAPETGTTVTNDPTGDSRTLFPLQSALGYSISQSLFMGGHNLVVEGVTDYWILSSIAEFIADKGSGTKLDKKFTITPAGGAPKVSYMVALLTSERLKVVVLMDDEPQARQIKSDLIKAKLIRDDAVGFVTEAFADPKPTEADIEDLLDPVVFDALMNEAYAKEIAGRAVPLNANIPRIAKRWEAALGDLDIAFHKTRPARLLLDKMGGTNPEGIATPATVERFQRLFGTLNKKLARSVTKDAEPFE